VNIAKLPELLNRPLVRVRPRLSPNVALLGFCGAPWTLATYMIAGAGTITP